ncbi:SDR family NAD(P)-dependent oxidoreductase [Streptomyces sp. NPDC058677]
MNNAAPQSSRVVAVTGAGTGRATARAFAAECAHVVAIGRRAEPLLETAAENDRIIALTADITAEGEPSRILQAVLEWWQSPPARSTAGLPRRGRLRGPGRDGGPDARAGWHSSGLRRAQPRPRCPYGQRGHGPAAPQGGPP